MAVNHGLGRGLAALLKEDAVAEAAPPAGRQTAPVDRIRPSAWQPRRAFEEAALADLAASIREHGVLQPLLVRPVGDGYELIAGERRLRAAVEAGLREVPVIVMEAADLDALQLALVENLQREDLNVLEEAHGYQTLADRFNMTQEQIAARVGKARASVANAIRLLNLPVTVQGLIADGTLSAGHAKLLTGLDAPAEQELLARQAVKENLSVRQLEKRIRRLRVPRKARASRDDIPPPHMTYLSDKLHRHFGTGIRLHSCRTFANGRKGRGVIEVEFYSNDDLDRILTLMGVEGE